MERVEVKKVILCAALAFVLIVTGLAVLSGCSASVVTKTAAVYDWSQAAIGNHTAIIPFGSSDARDVIRALDAFEQSQHVRIISWDYASEQYLINGHGSNSALSVTFVRDGEATRSTAP